MNSKAQIRQLVKFRTQSLSLTEIHSQSVAVFNRLCVEHWFRNARNMLFYYSMNTELPTIPFIHMLAGQKRIFLPRISGDSLVVVPFSRQFQCHPRYHILEPVGEPTTDLAIIDVAIIPGLAFDQRGHRLGHGGGYYDRFLPLLQAIKVGIAFDCQLLPDLPVCPHDVSMNFVVTPSHFFHCDF